MQREVSTYEREQRLSRARERQSHALQIDSLARLERAWRHELAQWLLLTHALISTVPSAGNKKKHTAAAAAAATADHQRPEEWLAVDREWDDAALQEIVPTAPDRIATERKRFEQALKQVCAN